MARSDRSADVTWNEQPAKGSFALAGPAGGFAGGLAMAACLMLAAALQGLEPLAAIEPIGATFAGADAADGGEPSAALGVLLHLGVSALLGLLFAVVVPRDFPAKDAGVLCIAFAFVVMGFMASAIVPAVNPLLKSRFHDLGGAWVVAHAVFGFTTGSVCQLIRRGLEARAVRVRPPATV
jgi:hypothetical protein